MIRALLVAIALGCLSDAAYAGGDEIAPVPVVAVVGKPFFGSSVAAHVRFVNVRSEPVRLHWIHVDGSERPYVLLAPGEEIIQPTYVAHRWIARDPRDGAPLQAFISTRSTIRDLGTAQIALIR